MTIEIWFSGFALLISAIVAIYSYMQGRKSNELQEEQTDLQRRVVELEEKRETERKEEKIRANLRAEVDYRPTAAGRVAKKLRIVNEGQGAAKNIRIEIEGKSIEGCDFILKGNKSLDVLAAGNEFLLPMATSKDSPASWLTTLYWDDKTAKNQKFETTLTK